MRLTAPILTCNLPGASSPRMIAHHHSHLRLTGIVMAFLALVLGPAALAHGYKAGSLAIHHPWTRATPAGARVAGGYLVIENRGSEPDRLLGGASEAGTAVEVHEMSEADGIMRMRALPEGIVIPAGGTVEFKPGGLHLMITGLKRQLAEGEMVKATLSFEKAGRIDVELEVQAIGKVPARDEDDAHGGHTH
jgi:periplasmic copper chaperone A